jgi:uncharacterized protein
MLKNIAALALSAALSTPAAAQSLEAGETAFQSEDYVTALENFQPLAEQGDPAAQLWLGSMFSSGYGVTEDDAEALRWIYASAHQGHVDAQVALGGIYFLGKDVGPNYLRSQMWMNIAYANGYSDNSDTVEGLTRFLTKEQFERAEVLAQKCLTSGYKDCD